MSQEVLQDFPKKHNLPLYLFVSNQYVVGNLETKHWCIFASLERERYSKLGLQKPGLARRKKRYFYSLV